LILLGLLERSLCAPEGNIMPRGDGLQGVRFPMKQARVLTETEFKRLLAVVQQGRHAERNRLAVMLCKLRAGKIVTSIGRRGRNVASDEEPWRRWASKHPVRTSVSIS
jgi:hypothetical protein